MSEVLLGTRLDDQQREYAGTVRDSGEALLTIINDILDFSKFETGAIDIKPSEASIVDTLESAVDLLAPRAHAGGLEIASYAAPDLPDRIETDEGRLRQVLLNLIGNAIKFTPRGGVSCEAHRDRDAAGREVVKFIVIDTGIGIDEPTAERLFNPFVQADSSISRRYGGTGLGLAISRRLVVAMGGEISLESKPGEGSRFWVTLPIPDGHPVPETPRLRGRVLLAGCGTLTGESLRRQIEDWGGSVVETSTLAEARAGLVDASRAGSPFSAVLTTETAIRGEPAEADALARDVADLSALSRLILLSRAGDAPQAHSILKEDVAVLSMPVRRKQLLAALRDASAAHGRSEPQHPFRPLRILRRRRLGESNPRRACVGKGGPSGRCGQRRRGGGRSGTALVL